MIPPRLLFSGRFYVNKKTLMTASLVVAVTGVITASTGCSDDESTGSSSSAQTCPAVGSKNCPNDSAVSQADYDTCKKCETEAKAYSTCQGISGPPKCGADGKSEDVKVDLTKCQTELQAFGKCSQGG